VVEYGLKYAQNFRQLALQSRNSGKNKKGKPESECLFGSHVGLITIGSNEVKSDLTALIDFSILIIYY